MLQNQYQGWRTAPGNHRVLKRLRNSEVWLRFLCIELLRENVAQRLEGGFNRTIRIVDGTIVREPGKTGSQWRILYSIRLPSLVCDFFEVTATIGEGSGESLNRLRVGPHELILADAGYCSVAGIEYVWHHGSDALVRVNPQSFVAYSAFGRRIPPSAITDFVQSGTARRVARCHAWSRFGVCGPLVCSTKGGARFHLGGTGPNHGYRAGTQNGSGIREEAATGKTSQRKLRPNLV